MIYQFEPLPPKDERLDVRRMLEYLSPARRLEWLNWCCQLVSGNGFIYQIDGNDGTSTNQVLVDAMTLCWGRDPSTFRLIGERLALMLRGGA